MSGRALTAGIAVLLASVALADEPPRVAADAGEVAVYPELWLNGQGTGEFVRVETRSQGVGLPPQIVLDAGELRAQGLALSAGEIDADGHVALNRLRDIQVSYDEGEQQLRLELPVTRLRVNRFSAGRSYEPPQVGSQGILLNYDLLAQSSFYAVGGHQQLASGFAEARWFGDFGYVTQTAALRLGQSDESTLTRLETAFRHSSPDGLWTVQVGDSISYGVASQGAYRFGGLQWRRNFALRPDLVTFPIPDIKGGSAVPATVDVYFNNTKQYSQAVPAGPFEINNIPITTSAGDLRIVVRDVLGREQVTTLPLYSVSSLLRPGLSDFAAQTGVLRRNFGSVSNDYASTPVASGAYRYGWSDRLTVESQAEVTRGLTVAGGGAAYALSRWGTLSGAAAYSRHDDLAGGPAGGQGARGSIAYQYQSPAGWNLFTSGQRASAGFRDIATQDSLILTRASEQVGLGASIGHLGSFGVSYFSRETTDGARDQLLNASWSRSLASQLYIYVSLLKGLGESDQQSIYAGLSWYPSERTSISSTVASTRGQDIEYTVSAQKVAPSDVGLGWLVQSRFGGSSSQLADVRYRSSVGDSQMAIEHTAVADSVRLQQSGALVFMGGGLHAGRRINQSFAVVDTGLAGVPVRTENRVMGMTDRHGQILVTDLRPYQRNKISIDVLNVPAGIVVHDTEVSAVPPDQAGVRVSMPLREPQAALLHFLDEGGQPLPVGSQGNISGSKTLFVVGYDGEVYLEDVLGPVTATVLYGQTRCLASMDIPRGSLARTDTLAPVICRIRTQATHLVVPPGSKEKTR